MTRLLTGAGLLALVGLLIWLYGSARYDAGRLAERSAWQAKAAAATLDDLAARAQLDAARAAATQESSHDLEARLADALARAAHRSAVLRDAAPRSRGEPDMPGAAAPAGAADGAGEAPVLADAGDGSGQLADDAICAENTVKAQGWRDWWRMMSATGEGN